MAFILYPMVKWGGVWQRPQHLAARLAEKYETIYFSPIPLHHVLDGIFKFRRERILEHKSGIKVHRRLIFPGERSAMLTRRLNNALLRAYIREVIVSHNIQRYCLYTNDPMSDFLAHGLGEKLLLYDIIDDYTAYDWIPAAAVAMEKRLLKAANLVFTGTSWLFEKYKRYHQRIFYIPCGVDFEHFASVTQENLELPEDIAKIPRPILGYMGSVNERLDGELLVFLARSMPQWSIVLVGPVQRNYVLARFKSPLKVMINDPACDPDFKVGEDLPNIYYLGLKDYQALPSYLKAFDVCLLPYLINPATRSIHPVKVLEYLAADKAIVSTDVPDVIRFYKDVVHIAFNKEEYLQKCKKALEQGSNPKGKQMASQRSWEMMADEMLDKILGIASSLR